MPDNREVLLSVKNMSICFGKGKHLFKAVDNVSFDIYKGETFGLVGESGSGKTTIGRTIIRINPTTSGEIFFKGEKINGKISRELDRRVTREIQMIFQDPMASLNERAKVDYIVSEGLLNGEKMPEDERKARVEKAQKAVAGVETVEISLENKTATVTGSADASALRQAVTDAGYQVVE